MYRLGDQLSEPFTATTRLLRKDWENEIRLFLIVTHDDKAAPLVSESSPFGDYADWQYERSTADAIVL